MGNFRVSIVALFLALVVAVIVPPGRQARAEGPKTFVLVHGAWVGEWYWEPVARRLRAEGHAVHPVSLTGHGKRQVDGGPHVTLQDHVDDVVDVITENELTGVYLVAHSYGGRPATEAWDRARGRVHHVVYVDAVAPLSDGMAAIPAEDGALAAIRQRFPALAAGGMLPVRPQMAEAMRARSAPQSLKTLFGAIFLRYGPLPGETRRTFVVAARNPAATFRQTAGRLARDPRWRIVELDAGHDVAGDAPGALAALLMGLE